MSFIKTKIITNENDKIGIILFGCAETPSIKCENSMNFKNIHVLCELDVPDASLIKTLEHKISSFTADHGWFKPADESMEGQIDSSSVPVDDRSPLFEALWISHQEFKNVEK